jgi:hypothetical protein
LESPDGESLGNVRLDPDLVPAVRCAEFEQTLERGIGAHEPCGESVIEPLYSTPPWVRGIRIAAPGGDAASVEFPLTYFTSAVTRAASALVAAGKLVAGQRFDFKVYALAQAHHAGELQIEAVNGPPPIGQASLAALRLRSDIAGDDVSLAGRDADLAEPMPVFIAERVLDEASELAARAGEIETGGVLVGRLCRDADGPAFVEVTAQLPVEHTVATQHSLRLTPRTWVAVDAAIKLRNRAETALGWWHHHPFFCRRCPAARRALCPFSRPAFSQADRDVHREVFQNPWNVALLLSYLGAARPSYDVYAWHRGQIEAARFHILREAGRASAEGGRRR